jgi:hypothetical protein
VWFGEAPTDNSELQLRSAVDRHWQPFPVEWREFEIDMAAGGERDD